MPNLGTILFETHIYDPEGASSIAELAALMKGGELSFDEARVELVRRQMERHGIDPDTGLPLDEELGVNPAAETGAKPGIRRRPSGLNLTKTWAGPKSKVKRNPLRRTPWLLRFISG